MIFKLKYDEKYTVFLHEFITKIIFISKHFLSIYLSGLVTAVAVFRNPNTIPFEAWCLVFF